MKKLFKIFPLTFRVYSLNDMNVFSGNATLYLLLSMVPLLTLMVGAINLLPEEYLKSFFDLVIDLFPEVPQIQSLTSDLLSRVNPRSGTVVVSISILTMLWSASNGVTALQLGLMRISGTEQSVIRRRISALLYTVLFIVLIPALLIFRVLRGSLEEIALMLSEVFQMPEIGEAFVAILEESGLITLIATACVIVLTYTFLQGHARSLLHQLPGAVFGDLLRSLAGNCRHWDLRRHLRGLPDLLHCG